MLCPICEENPRTPSCQLEDLPAQEHRRVNDPTRWSWCPKHGRVDRGTEYHHTMEAQQ